MTHSHPIISKLNSPFPFFLFGIYFKKKNVFWQLFLKIFAERHIIFHSRGIFELVYRIIPFWTIKIQGVVSDMMQAPVVHGFLSGWWIRML